MRQVATFKLLNFFVFLLEGEEVSYPVKGDARVMKKMCSHEDQECLVCIR